MQRGSQLQVWVGRGDLQLRGGRRHPRRLLQDRERRHRPHPHRHHDRDVHRNDLQPGSQTL